MKYYLITILALIGITCSGCAGFQIERSFTIEGEGISVPYQLGSIKGEKIKLTRTARYGFEKAPPAGISIENQ